MASIEATLPLRLRELFDYGSAATGVIFLALLLPSVLAEVIGKLLRDTRADSKAEMLLRINFLIIV